MYLGVLFCHFCWSFFRHSPTDFYPINLLNIKLQDDHVLCLVIFQAIRWWVLVYDLHPIIDSNDVTGIQKLKSQNRRLFGGFKCFFFSPRFLEQWSNLTKICSRWVVQPPPRRLLLHVFWKKESFEFYDVCASRHAAGKSFRLSEGTPPHEQSKKQTCCSVSQGILLLLVVGMMIVHWNLYETKLQWNGIGVSPLLFCCVSHALNSVSFHMPLIRRDFSFQEHALCAVASLCDVHAVHEGVRSPRQLPSMVSV